MQLIERPTGFDIVEAGRVILRHTAEAPCVFVGRGDSEVEMLRGNFKIADYVIERVPLRAATVIREGEAVSVTLAPSAAETPLLVVTIAAGAIAIALARAGRIADDAGDLAGHAVIGGTGCAGADAKVDNVLGGDGLNRGAGREVDSQ